MKRTEPAFLQSRFESSPSPVPMTPAEPTLVCWHSERAGFEVLERALDALRNRRVRIAQVLYLVQEGRAPEAPRASLPTIEIMELPVKDPTRHTEVYAAVRDRVLPHLRGRGPVHVNLSPGTPAMHAVWLILHAGGAFPPDTRMWSSQYNPATKRTRIDPVEFPVTTWLSEVHEAGHVKPDLAVYEPQARSPARRAAFERLARYARVAGAPLLVLGERGTGKTRIVETLVASLKRRRQVVTVPCGGLDSSLAESLLFGHRKGAFTGAAGDRPGLLAEADGGILFLDEVQDLPKPAQRKLVRVFQDRERRFRPLGSDEELSVDVELVCASNLHVAGLRECLDPDLYDRISHLAVEVPSLRDCREDVADDWRRVWRELRHQESLPRDAPWSRDLGHALARHELPGNLRDLQRLAVLLMAWWPGQDVDASIAGALDEWTEGTVAAPPDNDTFGAGTRRDRIRWFRTRLAKWAKARYGTWASAAEALGCDEKTLRQDAVPDEAAGV